LHYPNGGEGKVSYGKGIEKINEYDISHLCNTESDSSGAPILSLLTNKVIGIHKAANKIKNFNIGTYLKFPLSELNFEITTKKIFFIISNYSTKNNTLEYSLINSKGIKNLKAGKNGEFIKEIIHNNKKFTVTICSFEIDPFELKNEPKDKSTDSYKATVKIIILKEIFFFVVLVIILYMILNLMIIE
jgi:hypothetical protein